MNSPSINWGGSPTIQTIPHEQPISAAAAENQAATVRGCQGQEKDRGTWTAEILNQSGRADGEAHLNWDKRASPAFNGSRSWNEEEPAEPRIRKSMEKELKGAGPDPILFLLRLGDQSCDSWNRASQAYLLWGGKVCPNHLRCIGGSLSMLEKDDPFEFYAT
ncbi:hypothetical protein IF2G_01176 [Cordyceps javanica]|nr:hypothetical protein IF2G_01176 [Cordyceps javanica]